MKQLSGSDAMFLQSEHGNNHMHVASLCIYDQSTAPGGGVRFKDVLRFFAGRLQQFPQFRRRLVNVPLALDRPYWLEDASFDVEFHVRHIALPHPGDWRQLCIQVARIHSRPLDRSKPLWEAYVIEGLHDVPGAPPGSFALYTKMHHAMIDGESGTEIMKALHSLSPDIPDVDEDGDGNRYHVDRDPTALELYSRALIHNAEKVPALARFSINTARRFAGVGMEAIGKLREEGLAEQSRLRRLLSGDIGALVPKLSPETRFSGKVSAHRVFEAVNLPLADFRKVRERVGQATINDQFLAIVGGALREYLASKGDLPEETMVAGVPLSLRGEEKGGDRGNQVGFTFIPVHTEIADPLVRLRAISADARDAKRRSDALGKELMRDLIDHVPNVIAHAMISNVRMPSLGLVVSNVRGPDVPLYMAGARLVSYAPISIVIDGVGLNVTGFSYAGTMCLCAISCREMLPDPAYFADCLRRSFESLKAAAAAEAAPIAASTTRHVPSSEAAQRVRSTPARPASRKRKVGAVNGKRARTGVHAGA
jgi:WS/DGAT/MGAT family acyltransferase